MVGTLLNASGIILGGVMALFCRGQLPSIYQGRLKVALAVATVIVGLGMSWRGMGGPWTDVLRQGLILMLALVLGNLLGRLLRLQHYSNLLGRYAQNQLQLASQNTAKAWNLGFLAGTVLFCSSPMGLLGAFFDGFSGNYAILLVKGVMDGLAVFALAKATRWGMAFSFLPVLAVQGSLSLFGQHVEHLLREQTAVLACLEIVGGMLVFCVSLIILELKRVPLTNYLPSLPVAVLLAWWWK
jgi:hypothetical protein